MPSTLSSVCTSAPWANFSMASADSMEPSMPLCTMYFMKCGTNGAKDARWVAILSTWEGFRTEELTRSLEGR